jgi:DNA-directed RNA polymerase specialized sigma24 family protein
VPNDDRPPLSREVLRAFLSRPETVKWVHAHVKASVPESDCEQVAQDALLEAWESASVPSDEAALNSWMRTITDRVIADYTALQVSRKRFKGKKPRAPARKDEAGLPVKDLYADDIADIDPSHDPTKETARTRGRIVRSFIEEQTAESRRERQTFEMMWEHFEDEKPYEQIATERGLTPNAVALRVHRFEKKYGERCEKYRNRVIMLWLCGGGAVVAIVVIVAWVFLHRGPKIEPIMPEPPPPAPTVSYDPRLDIAAPPAPSVQLVPPPEPGPPGPKGPAPRLKP